MNESDKSEFVRPEYACRILKVTPGTLRVWEGEGKIQCVRTKGGHRRYLKSSIYQLCTTTPKDTESTRECICYCRVSTPSQKEDLQRQITYFKRNYPSHRIIFDAGSGINFKRKGFNSILDLAIRGNIKEVVVTHRDRLCRFGFELFERIIKEYSNGSIVVLNQTQTSPESELTTDLISIITVFSSRLYGLRSHKIKKQIKELKVSPKNENIENTPSSNTGSKRKNKGNNRAVSMVL